MLWSLLRTLGFVYVSGAGGILWVLLWLIVYDKDPISVPLKSKGCLYLVALVFGWPYYAYLLFTD